MYIYVAQDWEGNVHVVDNRDYLPPDVTDFCECYLPDKERHSEVASLSLGFERWGFYQDNIGGDLRYK